MKVVAALLLLSLVNGCAVHYNQAVTQLETAKSCCDSLAELPYERFPSDGIVIFDLNDESPGYTFPSGKSFFKAFVLPDWKGPYRINIRSYALGERIDRAHIFYPNLLMLDEQFTVVTELVPKFLPAKSTFQEAVEENNWGMPARIEGTVWIDKPEYRFLVVNTTDALRERSTVWIEAVQGLGGVGAFLGMVPQGGFELKHSPFGRVVCEVVR